MNRSQRESIFLIIRPHIWHLSRKPIPWLIGVVYSPSISHHDSLECFHSLLISLISLSLRSQEKQSSWNFFSLELVILKQTIIHTNESLCVFWLSPFFFTHLIHSLPSYSSSTNSMSVDSTWASETLFGTWERPLQKKEIGGLRWLSVFSCLSENFLLPVIFD